MRAGAPFIAQRHHRINARCTARGNGTCGEPDAREHYGYGPKDHRVTYGDAKDQARNYSAQSQAAQQANSDPGQHHLHSFPDNEVQYATRHRSERHA